MDYLCQGSRASTWSAPVVQGNRLVVPGRGKNEDLLFCLDARNGDLFWVGSYPAPADTNYGPGPRATPCIDDDRVYSYGRSGDLVCWNLLDGKKRWHAKVAGEEDRMPQWGLSSSPLVNKDKVIIQGVGAGGTAFDKMTGDIIWKSAREGPTGYAAPVLSHHKGKDQLLIFHGKGLSGVDPENGAELWYTPWETRYKVNATTPVMDGDLIFITSFYGMGCKALKITDNWANDLWESKEVLAHHSDGIVLDSHLYTYSGVANSNRGEFKCLELGTGKVKWSSSKVGNGTIIHLDGFLLNLDYKGNLYLIKPNPERLTIVSEFPKAIPEVKQYSWTAPVAANGRLYLRYRQRLLCYDLLNE